MHIHILGICGTFMGGIARLACALGHRVSGSDANVYPPMSDQLEAAGIALQLGYRPEHLEPAPDLVLVGNALSRGNPAVEALLDSGIPYSSGPQWLAEQLLHQRWVLAVAGTHGKTSTASLLAWILEHAGLSPGFLIGGVPGNFGISARLGETPFFVVEADEYDTAFFDKRSKFVHYRPRTLVLNNLEFDHADIFDDLGMIQRQFHHLIRTVPGQGKIITNRSCDALKQVLAMGCWTPVEGFSLQSPGVGWSARLLRPDGSRFTVLLDGEPVADVQWALCGLHNVENALAALAAARHVGVPPQQGVAALAGFVPPRRRMELRGECNGIRVYDDFAHHPSAIASTLEGLRARVGRERIIVLLEPRSNTMRMGVMAQRLPEALQAADQVRVYSPEGLSWDAKAVFAPMGERVRVYAQVDALIESLLPELLPGDHLLVMSNGGFGNIHQRLLDRLRSRAEDGGRR